MKLEIYFACCTVPNFPAVGLKKVFFFFFLTSRCGVWRTDILVTWSASSMFGSNRKSHLDVCMWFIKTSLDIQSTCNDFDIWTFLDVEVMFISAHTTLEVKYCLIVSVVLLQILLVCNIGLKKLYDPQGNGDSSATVFVHSWDWSRSLVRLDSMCLEFALKKNIQLLKGKTRLAWASSNRWPNFPNFWLQLGDWGISLFNGPTLTQLSTGS